MKTIDYIRQNGIQHLVEELKIIVKRHPAHPNLVFLKYNHIESPMSHEVVQECRGLILDEADDWRVISYPFRKFFNYGEGNAASIDWKTARVYEKLDGSLMTLYWYAGKWNVASNGTPDAGGPVYGHSGTFADLFWETFYANGYRLPGDPGWVDYGNEGYCYQFELMSPWNRVVVRHPVAWLAFIGIRELRNFEEFRPDAVNAHQLGWKIVRSYPLNSVTDCIDAANALNPAETEGFVVCDAAFNRIKIKSPQYVALHHMKDGFSGRRLLEILRTNESSEFIVHFPEYRPAFEDAKQKYAVLCSSIEEDFERLKSIPVQKDFAIEAIHTKCSAALFSLRSKKVKSVREFFASSTLATLEKLLTVSIDPALEPELMTL